MRIALIGGSGTIGREVDRVLVSRGHEVIVATRSSTPAIDTSSDEGIDAFFAEHGTVDAVIATFGHTPFAPLADLGAEDFQEAFGGKTLPQIRVALRAIPYLADGSSITLTTGVLAREPIATGTTSSMANGAIESFVMSAATQLPRGLRINAVSPSVLVESPGSHDAFPGFTQVPAATVADSFVRSVENVETGKVFVP